MGVTDIAASPAPTTGDAAAEPPRARTNLVFVTIMFGMLMATLDQTIVSTALPTIVVDLGGAGHTFWVVTHSAPGSPLCRGSTETACSARSTTSMIAIGRTGRID